jgi:hypothetical protein
MANYASLKGDPAHLKQYKAVKKSINLLAQDPHHPGLQTHEYDSISSCVLDSAMTSGNYR